MGAAPKKQVRHLGSTTGPVKAPTIDLRLEKAKLEKMRDHLEKKILDNPEVAKKAAALISLWLQNETPKKKR